MQIAMDGEDAVDEMDSQTASNTMPFSMTPQKKRLIIGGSTGPLSYNTWNSTTDSGNNYAYLNHK